MSKISPKNIVTQNTDFVWKVRSKKLKNFRYIKSKPWFAMWYYRIISRLQGRKYHFGYYSDTQVKCLPTWLLEDRTYIPKKYYERMYRQTGNWSSVLFRSSDEQKSQLKEFQDIHVFLKHIGIVSKNTPAEIVLGHVCMMEEYFRIPFFLELPISGKKQIRPLTRTEKKHYIVAFNFLETGSKYAPITKHSMKKILDGKTDVRVTKKRYQSFCTSVLFNKNSSYANSLDMRRAVLKVHTIYALFYWIVVMKPKIRNINL